MPRARSYNWRTDPAYKMSPTHVNKMMRPQTHKLLDKLRHMTILQEPGMANVVIHDLAHWFLARNKEEVLLGKAAADLMQMWVGMVKNEADQPAYIYGQPENHPDSARERVRNWIGHYGVLMSGGTLSNEIHRAAAIQGEEDARLYLEDLKALLQHTDPHDHDIEHCGPCDQIYNQGVADGYGNGFDAGSAPSAQGTEGEAPQIDLDDRDTKMGIRLVIEMHQAGKGSPAWMIKCGCGRDFAATEEWANHVRARIWRSFKNTFPPIGEGTDG